MQTALTECVYMDDMQTADLSCPFTYPDKKKSGKKKNIDINKLSVKPKEFTFILHTGLTSSVICS